MSIYTASVPVYRGYTFPVWSIVLGWCLAFSSVAAVPIVAFYTWYTKGTKSISTSPSKSPKKPGGGGGGSSYSGHGGGVSSRNASSATRKSPSHSQCKPMAVNYCSTGGIQSSIPSGVGGIQSGNQMTTTNTTITSNIITSPTDHLYNRGSSRIKEDML